MIGAGDKPWNSALTLYLARRLDAIAAGHKLTVLDMGCGDGLTMAMLMEYGHDLYGYDLSMKGAYDLDRRANLEAFGETYDQHIKLTDSERTIPFPDASFDVIYSNQVFEHVRYFDSMISECARVLKPGGALVATFPLATSPLEGHVRVPFAHWLPPGRFRARYLELALRVGFRPRTKRGRTPVRVSPREKSISQDHYLSTETFYRFRNEIEAVALGSFASCSVDTSSTVQAKIDLWLLRKGRKARIARAVRWLDRGGLLSCAVTYYVNAAFVMVKAGSVADAAAGAPSG